MRLTEFIDFMDMFYIVLCNIIHVFDLFFQSVMLHDHLADVTRSTYYTGARRLDSFSFFAFSPVWRPLRYVHAIILPLKPFLSILNQPSSMGYYIDKVGNAVS